jgi:hypothetical protein
MSSCPPPPGEKILLTAKTFAPLLVGCKSLLHMRTFYALIGYACAIYHLTYHNKNAKYISIKLETARA